MEEFINNFVTFGAGFACGCLYSSYKFDRNPNELVDMAANDVKSAATSAGNAVKSVANGVKDKIQSFKKDGNENEIVVEEVIT